MSPELRAVIKDVIDLARAKVGTGNPSVDTLRTQVIEALQRGETETAARLFPQLQATEGLQRDFEAGLNGPLSRLIEFLESHGLAKQDINLSDLVPVKTVHPESQVKEGTPNYRTRKDARVDDEKYTGRPVEIAFLLIEKQDGKLKYDSRESIALATLKEGRDSKKDKIDACNRYQTYESHLSLGLTYSEKKTKASTMSELMDLILANKIEGAKEISDPRWREFYEEVKKEFGPMKPKDFIDKVVKRFYTKEDKKKEQKIHKAKAVEMEKREQILSKEIAPGKIKNTPSRELVLCMRLTHPQVLEKLQSLISSNKSMDEILVDSSWKMKGLNTMRILGESAGRIADRRKNEAITKSEENDAKNFILEALVQMAKSRRGWHMIDEDFKGFRMLYVLMGEISKDKSEEEKVRVAQNIWRALYSGVQIPLERDGITQISLPGAD